MNKWGELIKYLNSKKAKPEAVMNMVKAVYDRKSTVAPERTAWKFNEIVGIIANKNTTYYSNVVHLLELTSHRNICKIENKQYDVRDVNVRS